MQRRVNISISDDLLLRADAFARCERFTRSALIASALSAFIETDPRMVAVEGTTGMCAPESVGLNPAIRRHVPGIIAICREQGADFAGMVGACTRLDPALQPRQIELLVRFAPERSEIHHCIVLGSRIEMLTGLPVRVTRTIDVSEERRRKEFDPTLVVLYETSPLTAGPDGERM